MITAIYVDDFNQKHYIVLQDTTELNYIKERFSVVQIL